MTKWKEEFDKEFLEFCLENNIVFLGNYEEEKDSIQDFISNLIEQVIDDASSTYAYTSEQELELKDQLRDKYLN